MIRQALEYSTKYISGPTAEPVTIDEVKRALVLQDGNVFNETDLMRKAKAARLEAEGILGKRIGSQVWDVILDGWPCWSWPIPLDPVTELTAVYYTDSDGDEVEVSNTVYAFAAATGRVWLKAGQVWPDAELADFGGVRLRLKVGIVSPGENIREAILFRVGTFNAFREDMTLGTTMQAAKVGTFEALLGVDRTISI
jgi:uncharacterized phiE125 gp8 family phage protein